MALAARIAARAPLVPTIPIMDPPSLPALQLAADISRSQRVRLDCRNGILTGPTAQHAPGFLQANLVVLEKRFAFDFIMFAMKNSKACPLLDVIARNPPESKLAPGSDIRTDLPRYRVWSKGQIIQEITDVTSMWPKEAVSFLLGCSFSFENDLKRLGFLDKTSSSVPMYRTCVPNDRSGPFGGNLVVSMRMVEPQHVADVIRVTEKHGLSHGAPVGIGIQGQRSLGINNLENPDFGERPVIQESRVPIFWACGVTPQSALEQAIGDLADSVVITHAPGCMFVTDVSVS